MSSSRGAGIGATWFARSSSSSVVSPIALTATTTSWPARRVSTIRFATRLMLSASATDDPPYFWTISATVKTPWWGGQGGCAPVRPSYGRGHSAPAMCPPSGAYSLGRARRALVPVGGDRQLRLAAGERAQLEHVPAELGLGCARDDAGVAVRRGLGRVHVRAARREVGEDGSLQIGRHGDRHDRHRLEHDRPGVGESRLHARGMPPCGTPSRTSRPSATCRRTARRAHRRRDGPAGRRRRGRHGRPSRRPGCTSAAPSRRRRRRRTRSRRRAGAGLTRSCTTANWP